MMHTEDRHEHRRANGSHNKTPGSAEHPWFWVQLAWLLVACSGGLGCVGAFSPNASRTSQQTLSVGAENIQLLELDTLPDGIMFTNQSFSVQPGFPSAEDPHVLVDSYPVMGSGEQLRIQARNAAAEHGGNAVYVDVIRDRAYVFHVSRATPGYPKPSTLFTELEAAHVNRRYRKISDKKRSLDSFKSVSISAKPGRCYAVGIVLDEDASFSSAARRGLALTVRDPAGEQSFQLPVRRAQQYTLIRDHFAGVACASKTKSLSIDLYAGRSKVPAGQGTVIVRTYELGLTRDDRKHNCADLSDYLQPLARSEGLCR